MNIEDNDCIHRRACAAPLAALAAFAFVVASACESGTEGRAVRFGLTLRSVAESGFTAAGVFDTDTGWRVVLDEARVALGPVYLYAEPGATAARALERLLVPVARAHGGTDPSAGRVVRGEHLGVVVLDALATEPVRIASVAGRAGRAVSLRVDLPGPAADVDGVLRGHHAWIRGTATRGAASIAFAGGLDIPDDGLAQHVDGVPLDGFVDDGVTVALDVHVRAWLAAAHFDRLPAPGPDGVCAIPAETQVRTAWYLGARSLAAFSASITP